MGNDTDIHDESRSMWNWESKVKQMDEFCPKPIRMALVLPNPPNAKSFLTGFNGFSKIKAVSKLANY